MGLKGRIEELLLLDILQIVAFSQKTGYLCMEGPQGRGAVVFRNGLVQCCYSWSTLAHLRRIAEGGPEGASEEILQNQLEVSLRELAGLREGTFEFELTEEAVTELEGIDITSFSRRQGLNPQHMLLELASSMDEERRDATALVEQESLAEEAPEEGAEEAFSEAETDERTREEDRDLSVVVVDDEPMIAEVLGEEIASKGYRVFTAGGPAEGASLARKREESGERVVVVSDLKMPTSSQRSFFGGFELVQRLNRTGAKAPVLLMAEALSDGARARAIELGIRKVAFKPTLSKPHRAEYDADLRAFAGEILRQLAIMTSSEAGSADKVPHSSERGSNEGALLLEYLASMSAQMVRPQRPTHVTKIVLQVAAKFMERGILFLVKKDKATGLAGVGISVDAEESVALAQKLTVDVKKTEPFSKVLRTQRTWGPSKEFESLEDSIYARIGRGEARECVLMPLLNNGEVLTILFGDNGVSGRRLGPFHGLELLLAQAGMALENTFLQRKLRALEFKEVPVREVRT